jgi:hypothetical protein
MLQLRTFLIRELIMLRQVRNLCLRIYRDFISTKCTATATSVFQASL